MTNKLIKSLALGAFAIGGGITTLASTSCGSSAPSPEIGYHLCCDGEDGALDPNHRTRKTCFYVEKGDGPFNNRVSCLYFNVTPLFSNEPLQPTDFRIDITNFDPYSSWFPEDDMKNSVFISDKNNTNDNTTYYWKLQCDFLHQAPFSQDSWQSFRMCIYNIKTGMYSNDIVCLVDFWCTSNLITSVPA